MSWKVKYPRPEVAVSLAATVIALAALGVSIWEGVENRLNHRMSLAPYLMGAASSTGMDQYYGLAVNNLGTGPAFVDTFQAIVDNDLVRSLTPQDVMFALREKGILRDWHTLGHLYRGDAIYPGSSLPLFALYYNDTSGTRITEFKQSMRRVQFRIVYSSIYHDGMRSVLVRTQLPK